MLSIAKVFRNIHFLPHFHYFYQWVKFAIFQINTKFLINQLQTYFYARYLTVLLHCNKSFVLSIAQRNINFLAHTNYFSQWMRCAIFQINTDLLVIYQNINIFTQETSYLSIIWKKIWRFPAKTFFETSTFYNLFTILKSKCGL